jgi:16S rRNA (cytidine1402-2'-O)-methyltransferase
MCVMSAKNLPPDIYVLALPLGNPEDMTLRGQRVLLEADWIFCEDKRKLQVLLSALNIKTKESCRWKSIPSDQEWKYDWSHLEKESGQETPLKVVLVSDAGSPVVNDPGKALVEEALKRNWNLRALPGASAPILAVQWSGGFGLPICFAGFAPRESGKSFDNFAQQAQRAGTFVFFDTRYNVVSTLKNFEKAGWAQSPIFLAREMTKKYEELWSGSVEEIRVRVEAKLKEDNALGELTLVLQGQYQTHSLGQRLEANSLELAKKIIEIAYLPPKEAAKSLSAIVGLSTQETYKLMVEMKLELGK